MASWRESASQEAQDDLDGLLDAALPFAQDMLAEHGEFFPYAMSLSTDGEEAIVAGDPGTGERPASTDVLSVLVSGLRAQRERLRALVILSDVRLDGADAIRAELEHREGQAMAIFLPYKRRRFGRVVDYDDLRASAAQPQVWVD